MSVMLMVIMVIRSDANGDLVAHHDNPGQLGEPDPEVDEPVSEEDSARREVGDEKVVDQPG